MTTPGFVLCMDSEGYAKDRGDGWVVAYWDALGNSWTIGFGSTGKDIKKGTTWTRDHAVLRLQQGWDSAQAGVLRASPILQKYPIALDALTDFAYNCGIGAYQTSTLRRKVNAQDWQGAADEFPKWNHAAGKVVPGLTTRRLKEKAIFLSQFSNTGTAPVVDPGIDAPITTPVGSTNPEGDPTPPEPSLPRLSQENDNTASNTASADQPDDSAPRTTFGVVARFLQSLAGILRAHNQTTIDRRDEP